MIVDCYTHTWESREQLGRCLPPSGSPSHESGTTADTAANDFKRHWAAAEPVDTTFVLGFKSDYLGADLGNDQLSTYVKQHPDRLVGFAGIDPAHHKEAMTEMVRARDELSLKGVTVAPAAQDFHPTDSQAMLVYAEAARLRMPVIFDTGIYISSATKMEYAQPVLLDEIARELPDLRMVIAHMGYPWTNETIVLLAKHPHVYAEISWLLAQPWQAYQTLLSAYQFSVMDKLLFGSGFPMHSPSHGIEELYGIAHMIHETNLPMIPREKLRGIVERDALALLGIGDAAPTSQVHAPEPEEAQDEPQVA